MQNLRSMRLTKEASTLANFWVALAAATLLVGVGSHRPRPFRFGGKMRPPEPCRSAACTRLAALLSEAMSQTASPCDDFHEFVCAGWHRAHSQSIQQALRDVFIANVSALARRTTIPEHHQAPHEKAAQYFVACDNIVSASQDHIDDVKTLLHNGGITWPDVGKNNDIVGSMFYMSLVVKIPVLLRLSLKATAHPRTIVISDTMPIVYLTANPDTETKQSSAKNFFRVLYEAFSAKNVDDVDRRFRSLLNQTKHLFSLLKASLTTPKIANTSTSEIHLWTKVTSKASWKGALHKYWKITSNESIPVTILNKGYFSALFAHYRRFGAANTADLFGYLCAEALFSFTNRKIISSYYASEKAAIKHRDYCFRQTDNLMHFAFQQTFLTEVLSSNAVIDDINSLITRVLFSFDETLKAGWLFFGECSAYTSDSERFLYALTAYDLNSTELDYASFPDMTDNPIANWMAIAEAAPKVLDAEALSTHHLLDPHTRPEKSPIEPMHIEFSWYSLKAPPAVKLAGLGSRVAVKLFRELLSLVKGCHELRRNADELWTCIVSREDQAIGHFENVRNDVLVSIFTTGVLWPVLEGLITGGATPFAHFQNLTEPQLFFVLGCILLCGEKYGQAKCNMPLKDNVLFARAFSCRRGTPMRPAAACSHRGS